MATKRKKWRSGDLIARVRNNYGPPAFAFLEQLRRGTGWQANRSADAAALSLWPSRGIYVVGFEIKVDRSDWLRELKDPGKAEEIQRFCRHWWVVAPAGVVAEGELPESWGLMVPAGPGLKVAVNAPKLDHKPLDAGFAAAIVRRFAEQYVPAHSVDAMVDAGVGDKIRTLESRLDHEKKEHGRLAKRVGDFKAASGVDIYEGWHSAEKIGRAVKWYLNSGPGRVIRDLEQLAERAERVAEVAREEAASVLTGTTGAAEKPRKI